MFTALSWNAPWAGCRRLPRRPSVRRPCLEALEDRCLLSLDALVVKAAPSGPAKTTSVAVWTDVPDLGGRITTAAGSDLEITVAGEVQTTAAHAMFIRALVDGQLASPSDVDFALGGYTGTHSYTFAKTGLGSGPHEVKVQWEVNAGGTAFIGDRTLTLYASPEVANWRQVNEDGFFGLSVGDTAAGAPLFTFGDHLYLVNLTGELFMMSDPITRDWQDTGLKGSFTVIGDFLYREMGLDLFFIPKGASPLGTGWKKVTSQGLPGGGSPSPRTVFENQVYGVYNTPDGFQIYRSSDIGKDVMNWEVVATNSFGNPEENQQLAFLAVFGDRLCAGTNTRKMNLSFGDPAAYMSSGVEIWESPTGDLNSWKLVNNPGFGTKTQVYYQGKLVTISTNQTIMSWTVYKAPGEQQAHLSVGTATHFAPGGQICATMGRGLLGGRM